MMDQQEQTAGCSRIYVAGLPPYLEDQRLREIFGERGEITDAKVMKTRDGRSRQFGFIGFQSVDEASNAIHYFNNSYIDTHRIAVKFAEKAQSSNLSRPWSVHSEGSSRYEKKRKLDEAKDNPEKQIKVEKKRKAKQSPEDPATDDPELQEFLRVMQPRSKAATWANDDAVPASATANGRVSGKHGGKKAGKKAVQEAEDEEDAEYQVLPDSDSTRQPTEGHSAGKRELEAVVTDAGVSDLEYMRARMKGKSLQDSDEEEEEGPDSSEGAERSEEGSLNSAGSDGTELQASLDKGDLDDEDVEQSRRDSNKHASTTAKEEGQNDQEAIAKTGRLFLRNLSYQATESDLAELFQEYGELSEVHLVKDRATQKSKGIALIQFMEAANAEAAYAGLDGSIFQGRLLHILAAKPVPQAKGIEVEEEQDKKPAGFQQQKAAQQKAGAGNRAAWNTLFMRADTVAEAVAAHYGISKSQLLDKEAADLPVRMALGEAHVIAMTKASLAEAGVNTEALEASAAQSGKSATEQPGVERSSTALIVKNLPYTATEADLTETFGAAGVVARLVLPETKTLALIEYQKPGEARQAFKSLAFKRFQAAPLFLEWAPKDIFTGTVGKKAKVEVTTRDGATISKFNSTTHDGQPSIEKQGDEAMDVNALKGSDDDAESTSIYVKNLSWATKDAGLLKHFDTTVSALGGSVRAARVKQRKGPDGKQLSAGYGFVECSSETVAKATIKKLQGSMIDGHKLELRLSMKKGTRATSIQPSGARKDDHKKSTKIVVRNVAFEATSKEIRALFQPFGQVKSVRLPKKFNNSHRGFAFVDFLSHQEAVNAMSTVAGTHLYGRRLVTEWAAQDAGLDELREKTASRFQDAL